MGKEAQRSPNLTPSLHEIPASKRPPQSWRSFVVGLVWAVSFNLAILSIHALQLVLLPLAFVQATEPLYQKLCKGPFGKLCVWITQWFAPTRFVITGGAGLGQDWIVKDNKGRVTGVTLPDKAIWVSNHVTLCDWLYLWSFAYLSGHHASLYVVLKSELKKIPVIGWGAHLYGFVFLSRKWATDKVPFLRALARVSDEADRADRLALLVFPEGTIITGNTRPRSAAYAAKMSIPDTRQVLLPRSTGLFYALRALMRQHKRRSRRDGTRNSHSQNNATTGPALVDITLGYPGAVRPLPSSVLKKSANSTTTTTTTTTTTLEPDPKSFPDDWTWPEEHYPLTRVWFAQEPPPAIHVHVRAFKLDDIPGIRSRRRVRSQAGSVQTDNDELEDEDDEHDGDLVVARKEFDEWLIARWRDKDELMIDFAHHGSFEPRSTNSGSNSMVNADGDADGDGDEPNGDHTCRRGLDSAVEWPLRLRRAHEHFEPFALVLIVVILVLVFNWHSSSTISAIGTAGREIDPRVDAVASTVVKACCQKATQATVTTTTTVRALMGGHGQEL